jgi:methanogenic corrinoid protein MtbC1
MTCDTDKIAAADAIVAGKKAIAEQVVSRQYAENPSLLARFGPQGRERCLEDVIFHLAFLTPALRFDEPEIFFDYAAWLKSMLGARGVTVDHIKRNFELLSAVLRSELHDDAAPFCEVIDTAISQLPDYGDPPSELDAAAPYHQIAVQYLKHLRNHGEMSGAIAVIQQAVAQKLKITDIHRYIIAPALREMGRLWQLNLVTVAHEHYASRVTQVALSVLEPYKESAPRRNRTVLSFCPAGETHDTGLRMVADAFTLDGWTVVDLGANLPASALRNELFRVAADVILLSLSTPLNLESGQAVVQTIRKTETFHAAKIIIGGRFLSRFPRICESIGADNCVAEAQDAVTVANELMGDTV